jgi:hypothetical protein
MALPAVLYVSAAALRADMGSQAAWASLFVGPMMLLLGWALTTPPARGVDNIAPAARSAARVVVAGTAIAMVAELAPATPGFDLARSTGVALAVVASLVTLVHVSSLGGIAARRFQPRYQAALFAGLAWAVAVGLSLTKIVAPARVAGVDQLGIDYVVVAAGLAGIGTTLVASFQLFSQRRFEIGVAERTAAALWLTVLSLALGIFAALLSVAPPERVVPETALLAAACVTASAISQRPSSLSRVLRTAVSVTMLCAPVVCVAVVLAYKAPTHAGLILFVVTISAASLGLLSPRLAHRLAPERGRWLTVLDEAILAAKEPDPQQAIVAVLVAIRDGLDSDEGPAVLYRLASRDRTLVDRAGYLHTESAELPVGLLEIGSNEPERVLSTESLRYIQVQRPDVRDHVAWLDARGAGAVVLVFDEEVCVGALLWPAAGRVSPLSSEEVTLLRALANHLGAVTGAASQLARSRARELEAEDAVARAEARVDQLEGVVEKQAKRQRSLAEHLARPARVACYSPASQAALIASERVAAGGQSLCLIAPPGVDAVSWAAVVHLASPRGDGPLAIVDGTQGSEHGLERWSHAERSPLEVARAGTLVLLDAHAMPAEVQRYVGSHLPPDTSVIAVLPAPAIVLVENGQIDPHLADILGDRTVALPSLAERAEDLRALSLQMLTRIGMRMRGRPYGLTLQAQELLNEHDWPGNDAELEAVLLRAATQFDGDAIGAEHLARVIGDPTLAQSGRQRMMR